MGQRPSSTTIFVYTVLALFLGTTSSAFLVTSEGFSTMPTKRRHHHNTPAASAAAAGLSSPLKSPFPTSQKVQQGPSSSSSSLFVTRGGGGSGSGSALSAASSTGNDDNLSPMKKETECPVTKPFALLGSIWGSLGVVYILAKAIKRVTPIALEPMGASATLTLTPFQWSLYALNCLFFAYAEGYKGFQLKFAPLVVKRSFTLVIGTKQGNNPLNYLLAPLYSMGLFNATKKRMITSWSVTLGVAAIVALVKRLPPVWRCIMDAGVVVGLSWGTLSILYFYIQSMITGKTPNVDACLPTPKK